MPTQLKPQEDYRLDIKPHESVIAPDGTWFGPGWMKIIRTKDSKTGVLQREKELRLLKQRQEELQIEIADFEDQLETTEASLKEAEVNREAMQRQDSSLGSELSLKNAEFSAYSARWEHQQRRLAQISSEIEDIVHENTENAALIAESRLLQEEAEQALATLEQKRQSLDLLNQELQSRQHNTEQSIHEARQQVYSIKAQVESLKSIGKPDRQTD